MGSTENSTATSPLLKKVRVAGIVVPTVTPDLLKKLLAAAGVRFEAKAIEPYESLPKWVQPYVTDAGSVPVSPCGSNEMAVEGQARPTSLRS